MRLALDFVDILVQPFGAGMSWSLFLPPGSFVVELQQDSRDTAQFVSCRPHGGPGLWTSNRNTYSEWGAWAFLNKIHFACVSNQPTYKYCYRSFNPLKWDTPFIEVDIDTVIALVTDAILRLAHARNSSFIVFRGRKRLHEGSWRCEADRNDGNNRYSN